MCADTDEDILFKEVQASIAEGKMMLPVLRSLPPSESNTALIGLFEELISRLQNYKPQSRISVNHSEVESHLNLLKEKQERIRSLLTQTALSLQTSSLSPQSSSSSRPVPESTTDPSEELIAKLQSWLAGGTQSAANVANGHPNGEAIQQTPFEAPGEQVADRVAPSAKPSVEESMASLNWNVEIAAQITKLENLIEDTRRFEGMTSRLLSVTKRTHLRQPTEFLQQIITRFAELHKSFTSLLDHYAAMRDYPPSEKNFPEVRASTLLTMFQESTANLDHTLQSTKECLFTIFHLVRSRVENGVNDGSLCDTESGDDAPPNQSEETPAADNPATPPAFATRERVAASEQSDESPHSQALAAQKAYLAELQDQNRVEQEEIRRLLRQRDELAERLRMLKQAAVTAATLASPNQSAEFAPSADASTEAGKETPEVSIHSSVAERLEAKQRELSALKAQLAMLQQTDWNSNLAGITQSSLGTNRPATSFTTLLGQATSEPDREQRSNRFSASGDGAGFQKPTATLTHQVDRDPTPCASVGGVTSTETTDMARHQTWTSASCVGSSPMAPPSSVAHSVHDLNADQLINFLMTPTSHHSLKPNASLLGSGHSVRSRAAALPVCSSHHTSGTETNLMHESSSADRLDMPQLGQSPSPVAQNFCPVQTEANVSATQTPRGPEAVSGSFASHDSVEERLRRLEQAVSQLAQICRWLCLENSRLNTAISQLLVSTGTGRPVPSSNTGHAGPVPSAVSPAPFHSASVQPQLFHAGPSLPILPFTGGSQPSASFGLAAAGARSALTTGPDELQAALAQLWQQQANYLRMQNEFQRLLHQQIDNSDQPSVNGVAVPWRLPTAVSSGQPMSPAHAKPTAVPQPGLSSRSRTLPNPPMISASGFSPLTAYSGWPSTDPQWTVPQHIGSIAIPSQFGAPPVQSSLLCTTMGSFQPFTDPSVAASLISSRSSAQELAHLQPDATQYPFTELLDRLWNPPSSN